MKLSFRRKLEKYSPSKRAKLLILVSAFMVGVNSENFAQQTTNSLPQSSKTTSKVANKGAVFPDEYSELDNGSSPKKTKDNAVMKVLERSRQKYLQALVLVQKGDTTNAARFFEHSIEILNKLASYPGIEQNEDFTELAQSIIDDYETYIKSIDELGENTPLFVVRDKLFQEFEKIESTPETELAVTGKKTNVGTPKLPTNFTIPLDDNAYIEKSIKFLTVNRSGKRAFTNWLARSTKWFPMMKRIAREEGMPEEILLLAMNESGLDPNAVSNKNAVGLWQFMRPTGTDFGLNKSASIWIDERRDPEKSTRAAMKYLKNLKNDLGDWYLALAAYNAGPGTIRRAIKKAGSDDSLNYWTVRKFLPKETAIYVPLFVATMKVMADPEFYGIDTKAIKYEPEYKYDVFTLTEPVSISAIAKAANITEKEVYSLNPELISSSTPPDVSDYKLKLPIGSATSFSKNYAQLSQEEKFPWINHIVSKRETVASIAQKYGVSIRQVLAVNESINSKSKLTVGTTVKIPMDKSDMPDLAKEELEINNEPTPTKTKNAANVIEVPSSQRSKSQQVIANSKAINVKSADNSDYITHKVAKGESLFSIALKYGIRPTDLRNLNNISFDDDRINEGQVLRITPNKNNIAKADTKPKTVNHKVAKGETIAQLADEYGTSLDAIKKQNKLRNNKLKSGQVLKITTNADNSKSRDVADNAKSKRKVSHKVKSGENITSIATKYGVSTEQLKAWNTDKIDGTTIIANTTLNVYPEKTMKGDAPQTSKSKRTPKYYTIKSGDTFEKIAKKFDVEMDDLKKRNKGAKETALQIGKKIKIQ